MATSKAREKFIKEHPGAEEIAFDYDLAIDQIERIINSTLPHISVRHMAEKGEKTLGFTLYETVYACCDSEWIEGEKYKGILNYISYVTRKIDDFLLEANPDGCVNVFGQDAREHLIYFYKNLKTWLETYNKFMEALKDPEFMQRLERSNKALNDIKKKFEPLIKRYEKENKEEED